MEYETGNKVLNQLAQENDNNFDHQMHVDSRIGILPTLKVV